MIQRAVGRNEDRGRINQVPITRCQSIQFLAKKPSNFLRAYEAGMKYAKEILTTKKGMLRYIIKKLE